MNDINLNNSELLESLLKVGKIKTNLSSLSNSINSLSLSSELPSASKLYGIKSSISNISKSADKLYQLIEKNINLICDFSVDMQVLFSLYKNGYINAEGDWLVDPSDTFELGMIYDQTLYPNIKYGANDLATNGCGFFSLLSVITCNTGHVFSTDEITELANYAMAEKGLANDQLMERLANRLSKEYNFTWKKGSIDKLDSSLKNGTSVIALTNSSSHFVPITGILDNGNLVVNDTYGPSYWWNPVHRARIDESGFNRKNGELNISARGSDQNNDGENDDVWYFNFGNTKYNNVDFGTNLLSDIKIDDNVGNVSVNSIINNKGTAVDGSKYQIDVIGDIVKNPSIVLINHGAGGGGDAFASRGDYNYLDNWLSSNGSTLDNSLILRYNREFNGDNAAVNILNQVSKDYAVSIANSTTAGFSAGGEYSIKQMADFVRKSSDIKNPTIMLIDGYIQNKPSRVVSTEDLKILGENNAVIFAINERGITCDVKDYENWSDNYGINVIRIEDHYCYNYDNPHMGTLDNYFKSGMLNFQSGQGKFPAEGYCSTTLYNSKTGEWESIDITGKTLDDVYDVLKVHNNNSLLNGENINSFVEEVKPEVEPIVPSVEETKPKVEPVAPSVEETKPKVEPVVPSVEETKPEVESIVPSVEETKPEVESIVPSVEETKSEVESIVPSVEETKPKVEPVVPSVEETKPKVEPVVPSVEETKPKVEPVVPSVEETKPKVEPVVPSVEETKPEVEPVVPSVEESVGDSTNKKIAGGIIAALGASILTFISSKFIKKGKKNNDI